MNAAERLFAQRLERRAAGLQPELQKALLDGWTRLRALLAPAEIEAFVTSGAVDRLFAEVLTRPAIEAAFAPLRRRLRDGVEAAGRMIARDLPAGVRGETFDVLSADVVRGVRTLDSRVLSSLEDQTRETVRAFVENGIRDGVNPRTVARDLKRVVGLAPNQAAAVENFRRMLENGDREALTRELRDRRFDSTLKKAFGKGTPKGLTAYHGTDVEFSAFDPSKIGTTTDQGFLGRGFYFSTDPAVGRSSKHTLTVKLDIKKPLRVDLPDFRTDKRQVIRDALGLPRTASPEEVTAALRGRGHDSVILDYSKAGYKQQEIMVPDADRIAIQRGPAGLTPEQVDRMVGSYRKRMESFNAETQARTAALDAQRLGQDLTWRAAVDRGDVDGGSLFKRWSSSLDDRVRPEHRALHGEVVRYDEAFTNGEYVPGESTYNCRCMAIYFQARDPASARREGVGAGAA